MTETRGRTIPMSEKDAERKALVQVGENSPVEEVPINELPKEIQAAIEESGAEGDESVSVQVIVGENGVVLIEGKGKRKKTTPIDFGKDGLRPLWAAFINELFNTGFNQTEAYMRANKACTNRETARVEASKLLTIPNVARELRYRLRQQGVTEAYVIHNLMEIAEMRDSFRINAAVTAAATLAKSLGMLTDTKKQPFTGDNPAVFMPLYTKEEKEQFDKQKKEMGRITE